MTAGKDKKSFHERYVDSFTNSVVLGTLAVVTIAVSFVVYRRQRS
jgi:hypothetical protein